MKKTVYIDSKEDIENIKIKRRNIKLLVKGEEVYIINMELPKTSMSTLREVVQQELFLKFKKNENIMFDYIVISKDKKKVKVLVYLFHWKDEVVIRKIIEGGGRLQGIIPLQFYFLERYIKKIKEKTYYFVFKDENKLYLMEILNGRVVMNKVFKEGTILGKLNNEVKSVYQLGIDLKGFLGCSFNYFDLGYKL